jgi:hypothetical protein
MLRPTHARARSSLPNSIRARSRSWLAVVAPLALTGVLAGCGANARSSALKPSAATIGREGRIAGAPPATPPRSPFRFFSPSSFWNTAVVAGAPVDPASGVLVDALVRTVAGELTTKTGPWINTTQFSVPVYTVPANQPTVRVNLENPSRAPALQAAWGAVPLPPTAHPASGSDGVLVVWQPSTDKLWDFWRLAHRRDGWHASWGGAMRHVSSSSGAYGPDSWPGAKRWWGDSASSMEPVGGLISLEDLKLGVINHAIGMALPEIRAGEYASPAERDDGKSANPLSLPEGAHLRLNPNLDLASLHLPRVTLLIAEAAQKYGIFVRDGARNVVFFAQDPTPTGTNPYAGPEGYFEGSHPSQLLASFPWSQLELLKMNLHPSAGRP